MENEEVGMKNEELGSKNGTYPWGSARADLERARQLIEKHGYHRRAAELEDAEAWVNG